MPDPQPPPVNLRNPVAAAALALLLPGLGHLYQRRFLKSAIFFVGIMGLFGCGMATASGHGVYVRPAFGPQASKKEFIGYVAQAGVGAATWPAVVQARRFKSPRNSSAWSLRQPLAGRFEGAVQADVGGVEVEAAVTGTLDLEPTTNEYDGPTLAGTFKGRTAGGEPLNLRVGGYSVSVGPPVAASRRRTFHADVLNEAGRSVGILDGAVARPLWDWYAVPPAGEDETLINRRHGTRYDLAYILVMIAGLLNFLAVYDAYEGPALGTAPPRPQGATG